MGQGTPSEPHMRYDRKVGSQHRNRVCPSPTPNVLNHMPSLPMSTPESLVLAHSRILISSLLLLSSAGEWPRRLVLVHSLCRRRYMQMVDREVWSTQFGSVHDDCLV